ncbi:hypothetical protein JTB14_004609 [Gonioctena quinquepunctata]|nr:hypothetical protein JTB14_004609 [Gonioctena quinquepunctata]
MENSQLNKSSSDRSETPTLFPSPKQNIQPEEPINNSDDVAAGTAITLETLYEEIVKLRTICVSNKNFLNTIYTKVNSLELHQPNPQKDKLKNIPMKTLNEVQEFELQLENDDVKTSLAHLFKSLGGRDAKDHLYRCLGQLFTNELATQCSWFGQRGNYKVKDLYSIKILTESINNSNHPDVSYSYIDKHAGEWFRLSRQRLNREIKKKNAESQ